MKFNDINKRYTEVVAEYMANGYTINAGTMGGSQGEIASIDLTDGAEIIRIAVESFREWNDNVKEGIQIIVGRSTDGVKPNRGERMSSTIWTNHLDIIFCEKFFKIGESRKNGQYYDFYGTEAEADEAGAKNMERWRNRNKSNQHASKDITAKALQIVLPVVRREFKINRVVKTYVKVSKRDDGYYVSYKNTAYKMK
ncbi:MAG: hypothetical protein LIO94_06910 [Clostridiales bacterium]|nr:hypothetical protein [Clostridiales bacterium]